MGEVSGARLSKTMKAGAAASVEGIHKIQTWASPPRSPEGKRLCRVCVFDHGTLGRIGLMITLCAMIEWSANIVTTSFTSGNPCQTQHLLIQKAVKPKLFL